MSLATRIVVLICAAITLWCLKGGPSDWLRVYVLTAFANPKYEGIWILLPHVFLYSTLAALVAAVFWIVLASRSILPPISFRFDMEVLLWSIVGAGAALAVTIGYFELFYPAGTIHWIDPKPWSIVGNIFSNFYEEFLFRGFLLVALTAVFGFWPAAVLTSIAFGATHDQYPIDLQAMIAAVAMTWAMVARYARSIWAPYLAHMGLDVVADSLIG